MRALFLLRRFFFFYFITIIIAYTGVFGNNNGQQVITKIIKHAAELVDCERYGLTHWYMHSLMRSSCRCSVFMLDRSRQELYAQAFDVSMQGASEAKKTEIRFPISTGVAGSVARTGKVGHIYDCIIDRIFATVLLVSWCSSDVRCSWVSSYISRDGLAIS